MIKVYLCESNHKQLIHFKEILSKYISVENIEANVVFAKEDPMELLDVAGLKDDNPKLFFIDVQLEGCPIDGFTLVKRLQYQNHYFVFLALHGGLAYKVFEYELDILDYILKESLYLQSSNQKALKSRLDKIFEKVNDSIKRDKQKTIKLLYRDCLFEMSINDIICVQAVKETHKVEIYLPESKICVRETLKKIKDLTGENFVYINKSCIVQNNKIKQIDTKNRFIVLENNLKCEVSYREIKNLYTRLTNTDVLKVIEQKEG